MYVLHLVSADLATHKSKCRRRREEDDGEEDEDSKAEEEEKVKRIRRRLILMSRDNYSSKETIGP